MHRISDQLGYCHVSNITRPVYFGKRMCEKWLCVPVMRLTMTYSEVLTETFIFLVKQASRETTLSRKL